MRAILDGTQTQMRRLVLGAREVGGAWQYASTAGALVPWFVPMTPEYRLRMCTQEAYAWGTGAGCPLGVPGDRLSVRVRGTKRTAAKLQVTHVRVERLRDLSEDDARAPGVAAWPDGSWSDEQPIIAGGGRTKGSHPYTFAFACAWDERADVGLAWLREQAPTWFMNPWVWAVTFELAP